MAEPLVNDFTRIAMELKRVERETAERVTRTSPPVPTDIIVLDDDPNKGQWNWTSGSWAAPSDYDPA